MVWPFLGTKWLPRNSIFGSLRAGVVGVGIFSIGVSFATIFLSILFHSEVVKYFLTEFCTINQYTTENPILSDLNSTHGYVNVDAVPTYSKEPDVTLVNISTAVVFHVVVGTIGIVSHILVMINVITKHVKMVVFPWIFATASSCFGMIVLNLYGFFTAAAGNVADTIGLLVFLICGSIIQMYWFAMVCSFLLHLTHPPPVVVSKPN